MFKYIRHREVAQLGRALGLGPRGRRFESCLPDFYKTYGGLAQLGERLLCTQEVSGSIPLVSIFLSLHVNSANHSQSNGGVAQLARASGSYPGGHGFDPLRRYREPGPLAQVVRADGS